MIRRVLLLLLAAMSTLMLSPAYASPPLIIFFGPGSVVINPYGEAVLDNAAAAYRAADVRQLVVAGHSDRAGSADGNMRLALRRAEAVRAALVARGVPFARIRVEAHGETRLMVQTADGVAEAQNRYAQVFFSEMCNPPPGRSRSAGC